MTDYKITVVFTVKAERLEQAYRIVEHEIEKNIPFKKVPYSMNDSGIQNYNNIGVVE
mgnify:CR=1 FL=1